MRRLAFLPLLLALAGCTVLLSFPPAARGTTTFLASTTNLTANEAALPSLQNSVTCTGSSEQFFLLVSFYVQTGAEADNPRARIRIHETTTAVADQEVTVDLRHNALNLIQLPVTYTCADLGLGAHTWDVYGQKAGGAGLMNLTTSSSFQIVGSTVPGGVITSLNAQTNAVQTFALSTVAVSNDVAWQSAAGVHTLHLPNAATDARGLVSVGAQSFNGFKTFTAGMTSTHTGTNSTRMGVSAIASATNTTSIGHTASAQAENASAFGRLTDASGADSAAIGYNAQALADRSQAIGSQVTVEGEDTVAVSYNLALADTADRAVLVGNATGAGVEGTAVGYGAVAVANSGVFGAGSTVDTAGAYAIGGETSPLVTLFLGEGERSSALSAVTLTPSEMAGTNLAGVNITIRGGRQTGNAQGGDIRFETCNAGSSGTGQATCSLAWDIDAGTDSLRPAGLGIDIADATFPVDGLHVEEVLISDTSSTRATIRWDGAEPAAGKLEIESDGPISSTQINLAGRLELYDADGTITDGIVGVVMDNSFTMQGTVLRGFNLGPVGLDAATITWDVDGGNPILFVHSLSHTNSADEAIAWDEFHVFGDTPTIDYDGTTGAGSIAAYLSLESNPQMSGTGANRLTVDHYSQIVLRGSFGNNVDVAKRTAIEIFGGLTTGTGTMANERGLVINALSADSVGLANASATVYNESAQVLAAAGNTVLSNATAVSLSNSTGGSLTLTSTPTIATPALVDLPDRGKFLIITNADASDDIVLKDESTLAGSNLRLGGSADLTLGPTDTVILYYSTTVGDWVRVGGSDN